MENVIFVGKKDVKVFAVKDGVANLKEPLASFTLLSAAQAYVALIENKTAPAPVTEDVQAAGPFYTNDCKASVPTVEIRRMTYPGERDPLILTFVGDKELSASTRAAVFCSTLNELWVSELPAGGVRMAHLLGQRTAEQKTAWGSVAVSAEAEPEIKTFSDPGNNRHFFTGDARESRPTAEAPYFYRLNDDNAGYCVYVAEGNTVTNLNVDSGISPFVISDYPSPEDALSVVKAHVDLLNYNFKRLGGRRPAPTIINSNPRAETGDA